MNINKKLIALAVISLMSSNQLLAQDNLEWSLVKMRTND